MSSTTFSSIATSPSVAGESRGVGRREFARFGLATVVAATAANTLVYVVGSALVAYDPRFLPLANVSGAILFTLPAAIGAVLVYAALLRFARKPARTFAIISAVVFVLATIPDFAYIPSVPGATAGQTAVLVVMHIVAAGVIVGMLTSFGRAKGRTAR
jgi:uncharacterized protein DUF6069